MAKSRVLTTKEVSELLGVHINTVRAMTEDGRLKGFKTSENGHWRFNESDVLAVKDDEMIDTDSPKAILSNAIYMFDEIPKEFVQDKKRIWEFVQEFYGVKSIFGGQIMTAKHHEYIEMVNKKAFTWMAVGSFNFMTTYDKVKPAKQSDLKMKLLQISHAFGVVRHTGLMNTPIYTAIPLLLVDWNNQKWVVNGTLQQFYPNETKRGLVILPFKEAEKLYINLKEYSREEFSKVFDNERFVTELERKAEEKDIQ